MTASAQDIIAHLGLAPHPEGGWYRETWRAPPQSDGARSAGTAILFLLEAGQKSRWHRVDATELWLYQAGTACLLHTAEGEQGEGPRRSIRLGPHILTGDQIQAIIHPGEWQAAETQGDWVLVSCIVVPGFDFAGFDLAPPGWTPHAAW